LAGIDRLKEYLSEHAFFSEKEIEDFLKMYPEMGKFKANPYNEPPPNLPEPPIEDANVPEQEQPNAYDQEQQRQEFLDFFMEINDEEMGYFIHQLPIDDIKWIIEKKQYSEQHLREMLEQVDGPVLPKTFIDRLLQKLF